jgi:hypothetical protein
MKRVLVGIVVAMLAVGFSATGAQAEKKQASAEKKKGGKKKADAVPTSDKIAESLGDLKWGMTKDEVMSKFLNKVKEKYRPLIAKTKDAVQEDRLRQEARAEIEAIKKGAVDFDGKSTGWNVSFLKGEFTNGNDESMLVVRDGNSQNFYFFIGGKLWKWYKAFDASVFPAGNFGVFASGVQRRFGPAKDVQGELQSGEGQRHWLEWQDKQSRLRAIDLTDFYGFYSLVFEEKATVDNLARLRTNKEEVSDKKHAMVESVTGERSKNPDDSSNVVDRITGRLRQKEQAPEEQEAAPTTASAKSKKGKGKEEESSTPVRDDDDPISGLGL